MKGSVADFHRRAGGAGNSGWQTSDASLNRMKRLAITEQ